MLCVIISSFGKIAYYVYPVCVKILTFTGFCFCFFLLIEPFVECVYIFNAFNGYLFFICNLDTPKEVVPLPVFVLRYYRRMSRPFVAFDVISIASDFALCTSNNINKTEIKVVLKNLIFFIF